MLKCSNAACSLGPEATLVPLIVRMLLRSELYGTTTFSILATSYSPSTITRRFHPVAAARTLVPNHSNLSAFLSPLCSLIHRTK